ncbi:MAG: hypothetical protein AAGD32_18185 [Planctomycetota bacterium]
MSDAASRFAEVLDQRGGVKGQYPAKLQNHLDLMARTDPDLHAACMEALLGRSGDRWNVPDGHVSDAMRATGYDISHHTVRRWRQAWLDEHGDS